MKLKSTKIVATLGPASEGRLDELIAAGVDTFRINFSHQKHDAAPGLVERIRAAGRRAGRPIAVLADLRGPKVRTGPLHADLPDGLPVEAGDQVVLWYSATDPTRVEDGCRIVTTDVPEVVSSLGDGLRVLVDDGALELVVIGEPDAGATKIKCKVVRGGVIKSRKGINLPDSRLGMDAVTEKDRVDAKLALSLGADILALSFVQRARDIEILRQFVSDNIGPDSPFAPLIIAKIEKPTAVTDIDDILRAADGVMVARGDLGVESSLSEVPVAQKRIVAAAASAGKPAIVATQMLESMISSATPTRAEVSDVANAVIDGADALMLSGETSVGAHPVAAVEHMARAARAVEDHRALLDKSVPVSFNDLDMDAESRFHNSIARAAVTAASSSGEIAAIVVVTQSGSMAFRIAKLRPSTRLVAVCNDVAVYRRLALAFGYEAVLLESEHASTDDFLLAVEEELVERKLVANPTDSIVLCSGHNSHLPSLTNTLTIRPANHASRAKKAAENWDAVRDAVRLGGLLSHHG